MPGAEAACPKDVVQGRQWKSNYSLRRPYDPTEGFPVLVCEVDVPCSDTVCDDTFNATVVKSLDVSNGVYMCILVLICL